VSSVGAVASESHLFGSDVPALSFRRDAKVRAISGSVVDQLLNLDPVAASAPGSVLWLQANQPLDLRLNSLSGALVCNVL
jgi:hypothetical protein